MKNWKLLLAALAVCAVGYAEEKEPKAPKKEAPKQAVNPDKAPDFTLPDINKNKHSLKDYKDKFVILEWVNHGCPFVKKHYNSKNMQNLQKTYTGKGAVWLTICSSAPGKQGHMDAEGWKKAKERYGYNASAILMDPEGKVGKAYGARTTPQICIINKKGIRVYDGAIDDNGSANPEHIKTSKNYVKTVMDALLAGKESPMRRTKPYGCSVKYGYK